MPHLSRAPLSVQFSKTPLDYAAGEGNVAASQLLLDRGAKVAYLEKVSLIFQGVARALSVLGDDATPPLAMLSGCCIGNCARIAFVSNVLGNVASVPPVTVPRV